MSIEFLKKNKSLLKAFQCGIERETLRVTSQGTLSQKPHPKSLGAPLTHRYISTDFGEQQLEWNTPPCKTFPAAIRFLEEVMHFSLTKVKGELFWPFSMPCTLDDITIANYGTSHEGQEAMIYREGLKGRYGERLQMISGIHFNFSFNRPFWEKLHRFEKSRLPLQAFIDEKYLGIIRNFLREGWLLTYLFGASPDPKMPYATSMRMSDAGYYSRVQNQLAISFNSLKEYLADLKKTISTPKKEYRDIPLQLNDHILQNEHEHYSRIRPKAVPHKGETSLEAIEKRGIEYLEVRAIDLDPYHALGVSPEHIHFLHHFLLYCLFKSSPPLTKEMQRCLTCNQNLVAKEGRKKDLLLQCPRPTSLKKWGQRILKGMEAIPLNTPLEIERKKLEKPELTPSAILLKDIEKHGYQKVGLKLAKHHKKNLLEKPLSSKRLSALEEEVERSLIENQRLETASKILVSGYEDLELSTQILIGAALKEKIEVEVLDQKDQLIRLKKGNQVEYVKEATKTSKDSYISAHLLENKEVTKQLLREKGLSVPDGKSYTHIDEALNDYPLYEKKKVVVKPKSTNFGIGISFVPARDQTTFAHAVKGAFQCDRSIVVETFCPGEEFRFLVISGEVIGVAKRVPAHVIGDGKQTIKALVHEKNSDPSYYRDPKTYLHLGQAEKKVLKEQRLSPASIPKKGRKVFLRHNSNVSTGGDAVDVTVHPSYYKIALQATEALGAKICGVDMILPHPKKASTYAIIELNYNPVLFIHAYPYRGTPRDVAGPLLKLLF
ncbi:hypothetical protein [Candidatus Neptunochlamydia vexilliferae]|uniref:hypothetical protein n=1 Tax=Candidatus Neptunichlamydia vexilliferae TaxID=1651774 RepID=UPI001891C04E|nr:hypothetical protein [Candidatus Neptunochlamydia vexilliferae]